MGNSNSQRDYFFETPYEYRHKAANKSHPNTAYFTEILERRCKKFSPSIDSIVS
jgi:hypothetical protein